MKFSLKHAWLGSALVVSVFGARTMLGAADVAPASPPPAPIVKHIHVIKVAEGTPTAAPRYKVIVTLRARKAMQAGTAPTIRAWVGEDKTGTALLNTGRQILGDKNMVTAYFDFPALFRVPESAAVSGGAFYTFTIDSIPGTTVESDAGTTDTPVEPVNIAPPCP